MEVGAVVLIDLRTLVVSPPIDAVSVPIVVRGGELPADEGGDRIDGNPNSMDDDAPIDLLGSIPPFPPSLPPLPPPITPLPLLE